MQKAALYTAAVIFSAVAVAHGVRLIAGFNITIADFVVPIWVSFPGIFVAAALAIWMFVAAQRP